MDTTLREIDALVVDILEAMKCPLIESRGRCSFCGNFVYERVSREPQRHSDFGPDQPSVFGWVMDKGGYYHSACHKDAHPILRKIESEHGTHLQLVQWRTTWVNPPTEPKAECDCKDHQLLRRVVNLLKNLRS